jgi:hypothetical protein
MRHIALHRYYQIINYVCNLDEYFVAKCIQLVLLWYNGTKPNDQTPNDQMPNFTISNDRMSNDQTAEQSNDRTPES